MLLCLFVLLEYTIFADGQFYNFVHLCNNRETVDLGLELGANALEMDLQYASNGNPSEFRHKGLCDCTCMCLIPGTCKIFAPNSVCESLEKTNGNACNANIDAYELMKYVATKEQVAAIMLDCKINEQEKPFTLKQLDYAANKTMQLLERTLFANAKFKAKIIIEANRREFLASFGKLKSNYNDRVFLSIVDNTLEKSLEPWKELEELRNHRRIVYRIGATACNPFFIINNKASTLAAVNKVKGVFSLTYAWTLNRVSTMKRLVNYFDGIITNYPGRLAKIIQTEGIRLATPSDEIPLQISQNVITKTEGYQCGCSFFNRGCVISKAAPQNLACQCKKYLWWCSGGVVLCSDPKSNECQQPTTSLASCQQGRGDCEGY